MQARRSRGEAKLACVQPVCEHKIQSLSLGLACDGYGVGLRVQVVSKKLGQQLGHFFLKFPVFGPCRLVVVKMWALRWFRGMLLMANGSGFKLIPSFQIVTTKP